LHRKGKFLQILPFIVYFIVYLMNIKNIADHIKI
jgi:hypothetical protein